MNYVLSYWLDPDASSHREMELRKYFDLQCESKQRFGATQTIVTNIEYANAIKFLPPRGFSKEFGLFAKYFGLAQAIDAGLEFPIAMHDHDTFVNREIPHNPNAILSSSAPNNNFSEQLVVFPKICRASLEEYIQVLFSFDFPKNSRRGTGCEVRHENMYSSEYTQCELRPRPFRNCEIDDRLIVHDQVSHDIGGHHSLDEGYCETRPIASYVQAVHGHLNKGPASDALQAWLDVGEETESNSL